MSLVGDAAAPRRAPEHAQGKRDASDLDRLEVVGGGAALVATLRSHGYEVTDVPGVVALVRAGDPEAVARGDAQAREYQLSHEARRVPGAHTLG